MHLIFYLTLFVSWRILSTAESWFYSADRSGLSPCCCRLGSVNFHPEQFVQTGSLLKERRNAHNYIFHFDKMDNVLCSYNDFCVVNIDFVMSQANECLTLRSAIADPYILI